MPLVQSYIFGFLISLFPLNSEFKNGKHIICQTLHLKDIFRGYELGPVVREKPCVHSSQVSRHLGISYGLSPLSGGVVTEMGRSLQMCRYMNTTTVQKSYNTDVKYRCIKPLLWDFTAESKSWVFKYLIETYCGENQARMPQGE